MSINLCTSGKVLEFCSVRLYALCEINIICYPEGYMSTLKSAMILNLCYTAAVRLIIATLLPLLLD